MSTLWLESVMAGWEWAEHEVEVLRMASDARARYFQAKEELDRDGVTVVDRWGQRKLHPAHVVERDSRAAFLAAMRQLRFEESRQAGDLLALPARRGRRGA